MKKALALSTICISGAASALAQVPANGCYVRSYDATHLASNPAQGVAALRLWVFDESPDHRAAVIEARMVGQGQGARDGVGGMTLTQYAMCSEVDGGCFVECDGGSFQAASVQGGQGDILLSTSHFALGEQGCGGFSDLAEGVGQQTRYRLSAAAPESCESLSRTHPLPEAGCYGIDYSDMGSGQGVLGLRLRLDAADTGYAFPATQGVLAVMLPDGGRAREAGMGGARVQVPVWCSSRDGFCRTGADEGAFVASSAADGVTIVDRGYRIFGLGEAEMGLAVPGQAETRHALRLLPATECQGME